MSGAIPMASNTCDIVNLFEVQADPDDMAILFDSIISDSPSHPLKLTFIIPG